MDTGLEEQQRNKMSAVLAAVFADNHLLYMKTRSYHWNVGGEQFFELHQLFRKHYKKLEEAGDQIAERIRMLGLHVRNSMDAIMDNRSIEEENEVDLDAATIVSRLLQDHETIIRNLREAITQAKELDDEGNEDFLTARLQEHEKMAWMLRAYLK